MEAGSWFPVQTFFLVVRALKISKLLQTAMFDNMARVIFSCYQLTCIYMVNAKLSQVTNFTEGAVTRIAEIHALKFFSAVHLTQKVKVY